jgi:hypothetical protein
VKGTMSGKITMFWTNWRGNKITQDVNQVIDARDLSVEHKKQVVQVDVRDSQCQRLRDAAAGVQQHEGE